MARGDRQSWREFAGVKLDPGRLTGLLLAGMGGPAGGESVEPFLRNLFADPAILPLPRLVSAPLGAFIARRRGPALRERYLNLGLGGATPQLDWTRRQGRALAERLEARGVRVASAPAMRYWHPFAGESVRALREAGAEQFLILPTYPQYAAPTTGSSLADACAAVGREAPGAPLSLLADWHLLPGYLDALAENAAANLRSWADAGAAPESCALIYTAHSLPERFLEQGDPYLRQTRASVAGIHERLRGLLPEAGDWLTAIGGGASPHLAFQSKVGPLRWLGPSLVDETRRLVAAGCQRLLVQPVSFSCEHIETLYDLDIELAGDLKERGLVEFSRGSALGIHADWLASLGERLAEHCFAFPEMLEAPHVG